jgi:hypothetical protein
MGCKPCNESDLQGSSVKKLAHLEYLKFIFEVLMLSECKKCFLENLILSQKNFHFKIR